jgi:hypothetical protein
MRTGQAKPDVFVPLEEQTAEIRKTFEKCKDAFDKVLKLDQGVSKADNWTYTTEDKVQYLVVPQNFDDLAKMEGWTSLIGILYKYGVRMKRSNIIFEAQACNKDVIHFLAGMTNRIDQLSSLKEDSTLKISATSPKERGRCAVDMLLLKKYSKEVALEKFLPSTCTVNGVSFTKYYLGLLGGSAGVKSLKNLPDLMNTIIGKAGEKNSIPVMRLVSEFKIPFNVVVDDIIRKKKRTFKENGKTVIKDVPVHFPRISGSPFILNNDEDVFFKSQESAWKNTEKLAEAHIGGVRISEIINVRSQYSKYYAEKHHLIETYSSWKSRRLQAYKALVSTYLSDKQLKEWRLSNNSKQDALDHLPNMYREAESNKDWTDFKQVISDLHPRHIKGFKLSEKYETFTTESVRKAFGNMKWFDPNEVQTLKNSFAIMKSLTSEMSVIASKIPDRSQKRLKGNLEDTRVEGNEDVSDNESDMMKG